MKFTVEKAVLFKQVSNHGNFITDKSKGTILSCIRLEVKDGSLNIRSANNSTWYSSNMAVSDSEDGSIIVDYSKLLSVIKELTDKIITITEKDTFIVAKNVGSKATFKIKKAECSNYPSLETPSNLNFVDIDRRLFARAISKVIFAVSQDSSKISMTGIRLENTNNNIVLTATDGRRLSTIINEVGITSFGQITIPSKFLALVNKLNVDCENIGISVIGSNAIYIRLGESVMCSSLITQDYPKYERVIPTQLTDKVQFNKTDLKKALEQASVFADDRIKKVVFEFQNNTAKIFTVDIDKGEYETELPIQYSGSDIQLAFNYSYILDVLNEIGTETVDMLFSSSNPAVMICEENADKYKNVIMTMKY